MQDQTQHKFRSGYRKGVILGLTIAEIILLLLFALLLALAASLVRKNQLLQESRQTMILFQDAIEALDNASPSGEFKRRVEVVLVDSSVIEKKYQEKIARLEAMQIPDSLDQELIARKIDLSQAEGREKFFATMSTALKVEAEAAKSRFSSAALAARACEVGAEAIRLQGPEASPEAISNQLHQQKRQVAYWRDKATQQGRGGTLPNCYAVSGEQQFVFLYRADIYNDGISLTSALPDELSKQFSLDFPEPPPEGRSLSDADFLAITRRFFDYGQRRECRFSVLSKDMTDQGGKNRYKRARAVVGGNFYETPVREDR